MNLNQHRRPILIGLVLTGVALLFGPSVVDQGKSSATGINPVSNALSDLPSASDAPAQASPDLPAASPIDIVKSEDEMLQTSHKSRFDRPQITRAARHGWVRLPGEVSSAIEKATMLPEKMAADAPLTLTIILNRT